MLFTTVQFGVLFVMLLLLLAFLRRTPLRKLLLLVASYAFYMAWNPAFILLILGTTITDYLVARRMQLATEPRTRRILLGVSLGVNLGLLVIFKYAGLLASGLLFFYKAVGYTSDGPLWQLTLPVGISFFVFRGLSYTLDVYRGRIKPAATPLDYALYIAFFPQLLAGPIVRAVEFLPQLATPLLISARPAFLIMIAGGFVKKVVVADNLAPFASAVFADPTQYNSLTIVFATVAFATQIYCDFSGYSDIAIGLSGILGFSCPVNFDRPYFALNPVEFWRKWHITLSFWLRDYLFLPLANRWAYALRHRQLSRKASVFWGAQAALFVTFIICGMWHGAGWNFVAWGAWHGLLLVCYRPLAEWVTRRPSGKHLATGRLGGFVGWLLCQYLILIGWIMFVVPDASAMRFALQRFLVFDGSLSLQSPAGVHVMLVLGILGAFWIVHLILYRWDFKTRLANRPVGYAIAFVMLCTLLLALLWPTSSAPFIYFQF